MPLWEDHFTRGKHAKQLSLGANQTAGDSKFQMLMKLYFTDF